MTIDVSAVAAFAHSPSAVGSAAAPVQVGYGVSLTDFSGFQQSLAGAGLKLEAQPVSAPGEAATQLMKPFEFINGEAHRLSLDAQAAKAAGPDMSPGDVVMLTVRSQEFMFHCQLMSNIANRTSDGLAQLFRQQS